MERYDSDIQMYIENPKVKMKTLLFHRWLAETNKQTLSIPTGEYALALSMTTNLPIDKAVDGAFNFATQQELLRRHIADHGSY